MEPQFVVLDRIPEFAQMRTRPLVPVKAKRKARVSKKGRPLTKSLEKQMAEVQALRDRIRKAEARTTIQ